MSDDACYVGPKQSTVRFVRYTSNSDNQPEQVVDLELEAFFVFLSEHEVGPKDGPAWAPGWIEPGKKRRGVNVESFDVLAFDCDHMTKEQFEGTRENITGLEHLLYTTYSHDPSKDHYCARVVFSLSRRVLAKEYKTLWDAVVRAYRFSPDKKAKDPSRLFFLPRCPGEMLAHAINEYAPGTPLDVDGLLLSELQFKQTSHLDPERPPPPRPEALDEGAVNVDALRRALLSYNPLPEHDPDGEKRALIRRVLNGEKLSDKPGRGGVGHGRGSAAVQLGAILGTILPLGTPAEAVLNLVWPSLNATPRYDDDGDDSDTPERCVEKVLKYYEQNAQSKLERETAKGNIIAWIIGEAKKRNPYVIGSASDVTRINGTNGHAVAAPAAADGISVDLGDQSWKLQMHWNEKTGLPLPTSSNAEIVLRNHAAWRDALRFNELTKQVECVAGPIDARHREPSRLAFAVQNWLQRKENGFCMVLPLRAVEDQLLHVARDNPYNPVTTYLLSLKWDGVQRIDTFLEQYCNAQLEQNGMDVSEFVRTVSAYWFLGAVERGVHPGCQMDNVLVLEGLEGLKKSSVFRMLAAPFFTDSAIKLDDKDSKLLVAKVWVAELAELAAIKKTETEVQKNFLSRRFDDFRVPYGRVMEQFPRCCVFVGTTNEENYLSSVTGNRRYWTVKCTGKVDLDAVAQVKDQLWAEAVYRRLALGEKYWFEPEEWDRWAGIVSERETDNVGMDGIIEQIQSWWARIDVAKRPESFSMSEVLIAAFSYDKKDLLKTDALQLRVGRALKRIGFEKKRIRDGTVLLWRYFASETLRNVPKDPRAWHLTVLRQIASAQVPQEPTT